MSEEKLFVSDKTVVVPGEVLAQGMSYLPGAGTYRVNDKIVANRLGLLNIEGKVIKTVQMAGGYVPQRNDVIIGRVVDILMSGWRLNINSPYSAVLPLKDASFSYIEKGDDLTRYFELDDHLVCKITNVTTQKLVDVSCKGPGLMRLKGGRIVNVNTHKVPRIIGKRGSMVSMIKYATGCKIIVGQNGLIWINGEPEMEVIAVSTIKYIEEKSHVQGLTEKVKSMLENAVGKTINLDELPTNDSEEYSEGEQGHDGDQGGYREERRGGYDRGGDRGGYNRSGPRGGFREGGYRGGNGGGFREERRPFRESQHNNNDSSDRPAENKPFSEEN